MSNHTSADQREMARDNIGQRNAERSYEGVRFFAGQQEHWPQPLSLRASRTLARIQRAADECCVSRY